MSWLILVMVAIFLAVGGYVIRSGMREASTRPVLPSHYDPENYLADRSKSPGWCPHCETKNDPEYRFCQNCAAELRAREERVEASEGKSAWK